MLINAVQVKSNVGRLEILPAADGKGHQVWIDGKELEGVMKLVLTMEGIQPAVVELHFLNTFFEG